MNNTTSLKNLKEGDKAKVVKLLSEGSIKRRLQDIGVIEGTEIERLQSSPTGDPIAYFIRGAVIALRSEDSTNIIVAH